MSEFIMAIMLYWICRAVLYLLLCCYSKSLFAISPHEMVMQGDINCYAGGIDFDSPLYPMHTNYQEYLLHNPTCKPFSDEKKYAQELLFYKSDLEKLIQKIITAGKCPKLSKLLQGTLDLQKHMWDYVDDIAEPRKIHIEETVKSIQSEVHLFQAAVARDAMYCGVSDIATKIWPYWFLITQLKEVDLSLSGEVPYTQVIENGQEVETCKNIAASGSNDLKNFYVKLPKNEPVNVTLMFDAYYIKDQIIVRNSQGAQLYNSNCISGPINTEIPSQQLRLGEKLKIEVLAKCEGSDSTFWNLELDCFPLNPPPPNTSPTICEKYIAELITILEKMLKLYTPIQNHYWDKIICYHEYDKQLRTDLAPAPTNLELFEDEQECKVCPPRLKHKYELNEVPYYEGVMMLKEPSTPVQQITSQLFIKGKGLTQSNKSKTKEGLPLSKRGPAHKNSNEVYKINQSDFALTKHKFCAENENRLEIFATISKRYCLSGYPQLIQKKD